MTTPTPLGTPGASAILPILRAVYRRLDSPDRWTQHSDARDRWDLGVAPTDPEACKWCLTGAVRVESKSNLMAYQVIMSLAAQTPDTESAGVWEWNDRSWRKHSEVLALLDRAIAQEEYPK